VIAESLRDELLSVAGVASADVDDDGDTPSGVRVRLLPDADAQRVGLEVQRVLASHGMRSRVASDDTSPAPVVSVPPQPAPVPPRPVVPPPLPEPETLAQAAPEAAVAPPPAIPDPDARFVPLPEGGERPVLASLAFEESADGVTVTAVAADGRRFSRRAAAVSDQALSEAVVAAVGALSEGKPQRLLWVSSETIDGTQVVTVLVERADKARLAGAAVVRAAKAYAVARATWTALRG